MDDVLSLEVIATTSIFKIPIYRLFSEWVFSNIIKIMPYVEGDRSDCQPEVSSIARSRRLRVMVVVEGW